MGPGFKYNFNKSITQEDGMSSGGEQPYNVKKMHDGPGAESSATIGNKLVEIQE